MEELAEYEADRHKWKRRKENKNQASSRRGKKGGKDSKLAAIENLPGWSCCGIAKRFSVVH